jgi:signal transduction histidine kinase
MTALPGARDLPDSSLIWRDLNYDVGWEATPGGVIRCRSVLNRRSDIFNAVEGVNLRAIHCERSGKNALELLEEDKPVRHIEVRLPRIFGPQHLYITARRLPNGGAAGTFCGVDPQRDEVFQGQVALLSQTAEARKREEGYRREAEIMLQGLRILLGQSTAGQKLKELSGLAIEAIQGAMPLVLRVARDGLAQPLTEGAPPLARDPVLTKLLLSQLAPVVLHKQGSEHAERLRALVGSKAGDMAVVFLPVASESIALLCASRREGGFLPEDIGFASRFALILKQALVLKDEQEKLVQSGKLSALGQMSASLAHELRQPLNTISVAAQNLEMMAENGAVMPEVLGPKVERILAQVERASQIMDRIRRFSRKGGGTYVEADLAELAGGIRLLMEHVLMQSGTGLEIAVEPGLKAHCDPVQIEQVLVNLVRNAIDALSGIGSAQKMEKGVVTIRGRRTESGVAVRVEDNGPGFPPDVASRPLETFFTTKGAEAGTGLGLSICQVIAREHAGRLELGNHAGGGAYVELHLPDRDDAET